MMSATKTGTVVQVLDLDVAIIESLPESVLSELIGFLEYDNRLACEDQQGRSRAIIESVADKTRT
jgi:hypothetical protein